MGNYQEEDDEPIIESTATRVEAPQPTQQPSGPAPNNQAVSRAVDGGIIPPPARSAGAVIDLLEDGQLSYEAHEQLKELAAKITEVATATNGKTRGEMTIKIKIEKNGQEEALHMQAEVKTKAPELPRRRSILWQDEGGSFTRFPPRQAQMFGTAAVRRVG